MIISLNDNRMSGFAEKIFSDWAYEIETGERESQRDSLVKFITMTIQ